MEYSVVNQRSLKQPEVETKRLTRGQKESIGLLQVGTFLEYFDLMLYIHMAVLLNELFFPAADPYTKSLMQAFAFCSTYLFRPFGALIFGYIGDSIGRKSTVILTTMLMSFSCILMANLPTYAQIGITASIIITICRMIQGLSSMGEIIGAQIYVTEITEPPVQYPAVSFVSLAALFGGAVSVAIASLVTHCGLNWRLAFWIGASIAVVGSIARTRLRETPEFLAAKARVKKEPFKSKRQDSDCQKISYKNLTAFYFLYAGWPLTFYLVFIYFNPLLMGSFGYSSETVILHNFFLAAISLLAGCLCTVLSYRIHPLTISKVKASLGALFAVFLPVILINSSTAIHIFLVQSALLLFSLGSIPSEAIAIKSFPVLQRFKASSLMYAASRAVIYLFTSFGLVCLTNWLGYWSIYVVYFPMVAGFLWSVRYFERLEKLPHSEKFFSFHFLKNIQKPKSDQLLQEESPPKEKTTFKTKKTYLSQR